MFTETDQLAATTLRMLSIDAVQAANSGHPGLPLGAADMALVLWTRHMKHNPAQPGWPNRDRFVLSAGHGSALLYALLHLAGYPLTMEQVQNFRQWGSLTPGHPEYDPEIGIETTTGPLGQGFANAVGLALAERMLAEKFNQPDFPLVDHYTYVIASDGDLMEGVSHEAASLAGHIGPADHTDNPAEVFSADRMVYLLHWPHHSERRAFSGGLIDNNLVPFHERVFAGHGPDDAAGRKLL